MIIRWIKTWATRGQEKNEDVNFEPKAKLSETSRTAMEYQAMEKRDELEGLVKNGWFETRRRGLKARVFKKVWEKVTDAPFFSNDVIVEEVTDKMTEAAENDPKFRALFG